MSITYEEALSTLTSMFGPPWSQQTLGLILRQNKGHMERTIDIVLSSGDKTPDEVIKEVMLQTQPNGVSQARNGGGRGGDDTSRDEEMARRLANEPDVDNTPPPQQHQPKPTQNTQPATPKGRGTFTTLPDAFLRVPGYVNSSQLSNQSSQPQHSNLHLQSNEYNEPNSPGGGGSSMMQSDEALARMLQNELFLNEVSSMPEFEHLSSSQRGGGGGGGGGVQRGNSNRFPGNGGGGGGGGVPSSPAPKRTTDSKSIASQIGSMTDDAKKRLSSLFASSKFKLSGKNGGDRSGGEYERAGLLMEDDEEEITFSPITTGGGGGGGSNDRERTHSSSSGQGEMKRGEDDGMEMGEFLGGGDGKKRD